MTVLLRLNLFVLLCILSLSGRVLAEQPPNILFIYLDDFGWRDASFMGSDFFETPHLDRLAGEGMVFTNAYSAAANCAPARACLLSGQYTPRHEIYNVGTRPRGDARHRRLKHVPGVETLRPDIKTWAECFREADYTTAIMGKWHLSDDPRDYGFDINIGGTHSGSPPKGYYPPHKVPGLENAPADEYLTDRLSREACAFIRNQQEKPWLLYLSHFAVHTPLQPKKELVDKYQDKSPGKLHKHVTMATMIQAVDDGIGQIVETLDQLQLTDNTIVLFFSDNGGLAAATDMAPLRGYKGTYYEGGIREPFFVKWPGVVQAGSKCESPIIGVDLYPTLCEMAGIEMPDQICDGRSIVPMLRQRGAVQERPLYWHFPAYLQASGQVEREECRDPLFRTRPCSVVRYGPWKLHQYFEDGGIELYNLLDDPGEQHNLAETHPDQKRELLYQLTAWQQEIDAPIPQTPNPQFDPKAEAEAIRKHR
ncbi:sulfatase [Rubinisphaera margarita]|uniref:sulfatase n=1 Tax=Rubinisphaera margarita TaxID=2909586 RepID=UPI001EE844DE|nr:sulfatase [Rubinisphaera margarita]MCG6155662.1 sulfatase [Rubinisphaera margarita]